MTREKNIFFW